MTGDPGTGKSTLIEFMWRTFGRDGYEGFDPQKSTSAGIARNLSKVGNLPIVLIEGDRQDEGKNNHAKRFAWEELKTAFNGRSPRTRRGIASFSATTTASVMLDLSSCANRRASASASAFLMRSSRRAHSA